MESLTLDLSEWPRAAEVREYARRGGISVAEAVQQLVNSGLSHYTGASLLPPFR